MTFVKASLTQMKRMEKEMKEKMERNKKMGRKNKMGRKKKMERNKKTTSDGYKLTSKWPY